MKLHDDKFVYLNFNARHVNFSLENLPFYKENMFYTTQDGHILEPFESVKDLGVTFNEKLNWSNHISLIVKKGKAKSWLGPQHFQGSVTLCHEDSLQVSC